jgi:5'(3')-deoxyribonucleotidase
MKPGLKVLVDLDGILVDSLPHWLRHIHHDHGVGAHLGDIVSWDMKENAPLDNLHPDKIYGILQKPGFNATAPIMHGARRAINHLEAEGADVYVLTARNGPVSVPETYTWLKYHLPEFNIHKRLIFCYDKFLVKGDVLIEDKEETLVKYAETHPDSLRLGISYPYNLHVKSEVAKLFPYGPDAWDGMLAYILEKTNG